MIVFLDSLRAGHAYLELLKPGEQQGETFGFYPAKADEKKEVLFGKGSVRKDAERLESSGKDSKIRQTGKTVHLTKSEFDQAVAFIEKQQRKPNLYFLVGYNCIDFIQNVLQAAMGKDAPSFLELYDHAELEQLSWVGVYARIEKVMGAGTSKLEF